MAHITDLLEAGWLGDGNVLRLLQHLNRITDQQAADLCFVSEKTYQRWKRDRCPNPMAVRLLAIMAGYVPWDGWQAWEMHRGYLFPPGYSRHGLKPGDIMAVTFNKQLVTEYRRQLEDMRALPTTRLGEISLIG